MKLRCMECGKWFWQVKIKESGICEPCVKEGLTNLFGKIRESSGASEDVRSLAKELISDINDQEKQDTSQVLDRNLGLSSGFAFPQRIAPSFQDRIKAQHAEGLEAKAIGDTHLVASWTEQLFRRREDFPVFSALNGRGVIEILFSNRNFANLNAVNECIVSGFPLSFQVEAFLRADYPFLRCHLLFPTAPPNAMVLEFALDVADGDIQDFIEALMKDEHIDFIIGHKDDMASGNLITMACSAEGIRSKMKSEVNKVLDTYRPHMTMDMFRDAQQVMFNAFDGEADGVEREKLVFLRLVGKAKNELITFEEQEPIIPKKLSDDVSTVACDSGGSPSVLCGSSDDMTEYASPATALENWDHDSALKILEDKGEGISDEERLMKAVCLYQLCAFEKAAEIARALCELETVKADAAFILVQLQLVGLIEDSDMDSLLQMLMSNIGSSTNKESSLAEHIRALAPYVSSNTVQSMLKKAKDCPLADGSDISPYSEKLMLSGVKVILTCDDNSGLHLSCSWHKLYRLAAGHEVAWGSLLARQFFGADINIKTISRLEDIVHARKEQRSFGGSGAVGVFHNNVVHFFC